MPDLYNLLGVSRPFDPANRFTTSSIFPTIVFAFIRILLSLYAFTTIFTVLGWDSTHGRRKAARDWFSYFTNLTYCGLAFYFLFAGIHSLSYALRGKSWLNSWPRPLQAAHSVYYTTIVIFPLLVTIVFWVVLYKGTWFPIALDAWSNISQHGLNSLYALIEIFLTRTNPPPVLHLAFLILILALYLGLAYLSRTTKGFYVYGFLNPAKGKSRVVGYVLGILAAVVIIFGVIWGIIWIRGWFIRRFELDFDRTGRKRKDAQNSIEGHDMVEIKDGSA